MNLIHCHKQEKGTIIQINSTIILWYISGLENQWFKLWCHHRRATRQTQWSNFKLSCKKMWENGSAWWMSPETSPATFWETQRAVSEVLRRQRFIKYSSILWLVWSVSYRLESSEQVEDWYCSKINSLKKMNVWRHYHISNKL